jgi:hypothetical protein
MSFRLRRLVPLTLGVVLCSSSAAAQIQPYFGGGMLSPSGEFADYAKSGWMAFVGVQRPFMDPRCVIALTGFYGHAAHEGNLNDATNIPGLTVDLGYSLSTGRFRPYLRGGAGFLQHRYDPGDAPGESESETKFAFGAGAGIGTSVGSNTLFAGVHYTGAEDTNFMSFYVGFGLGGGAAPAFRPLIRR